ncbi:MAG: ATP-binding protein, partial [Methanobrevibacter sp.]|nr:ATP-binding protein [Methanobrevibacter sp.]
MKKLPIGISTFSEIIEKDYIYVDKTQNIYKMINTGKSYFLSRPRRFGKSLLVSTIEELFKGNEKLFEGLYIYDKWDWEKNNPVIKLDFGYIAHTSPEILEKSLDEFLNQIAAEHSLELQSTILTNKFQELIEEIHGKYGKKVVILIDEYDKAIVKNISNPKVLKANKKILQNFLGVLKANDKYIEFLFVTGVSKFTGTSLYSDFNSLDDITLDYKYSSICGYTQEDLEREFKDWISKTSESFNCPEKTLLSWIKEWYHGYSWEGKIKVYNPFSILNFFSKERFDNYWYRTGIPSFLKDKIMAKNNLKLLIEELHVFAYLLDSSDPLNVGLIPLLFQTGYLTVQKAEIKKGMDFYTLSIPNNEVKKSLFENLLTSYTDKDLEEIQTMKMEIAEQLEINDTEGLKENINSLLANIPYKIHGKDENYYHSIFLVWLQTMGFNIEAIHVTNIGEIDSVITIDEKTIVIEIKYSKSEKEEDLDKAIKKAFTQIHERKYFEKYLKRK